MCQTTIRRSQPICSCCALIRSAMAAKAVEREAAQLALLEELKVAAEKLGLQIREERLLREVGYRVRSGHCRLRADEIIFLERGLPVQAQIGRPAPVTSSIDTGAGRPIDDEALVQRARACRAESAQYVPRTGCTVGSTRIRSPGSWSRRAVYSRPPCTHVTS